jgi:hypothetical protein
METGKRRPKRNTLTRKLLCGGNEVCRTERKTKNPKILQQICIPGEPKISVAINSTGETSQQPKIRARKINTRTAANGSAQPRRVAEMCTKSKW